MSKWIVIEDIGRDLNPIGWGLKSPILKPSKFPIEVIGRLITVSGVTKMSEAFEHDHSIRVPLDQLNYRKPFREIWAELNPDKEFPWGSDATADKPLSAEADVNDFLVTGKYTIAPDKAPGVPPFTVSSTSMVDNFSDHSIGSVSSVPPQAVTSTTAVPNLNGTVDIGGGNIEIEESGAVTFSGSVIIPGGITTTVDEKVVDTDGPSTDNSSNNLQSLTDGETEADASASESGDKQEALVGDEAVKDVDTSDAANTGDVPSADTSKTPADTEPSNTSDQKDATPPPAQVKKQNQHRNRN